MLHDRVDVAHRAEDLSRPPTVAMRVQLWLAQRAETIPERSRQRSADVRHLCG